MHTYLDTDFFLKMKFTFWRGFFCSPNLNKIKKRAHMRILINTEIYVFLYRKKN
jgi:hypothetical protein